jgi:hypothetical protein
MGVGFNIPFEPPSSNCGPPQFPLPAEDRKGPSNTDEYARNHRFRIETMLPLGPQGVHQTDILLNAEKCTRPTVEFDEIKIHNGQDEIYRPGKHRWAPIEFTFYERVGASDDNDLIASAQGKPNLASQAIYNWWAGLSEASQGFETARGESLTGYSMLNWRESRQFKPDQQRGYQVDVSLSMIDGLGRNIWTYILYECWPLKVFSTDLNYADTELSRITVSLRYNRAEEVFSR